MAGGARLPNPPLSPPPHDEVVLHIASPSPLQIIQPLYRIGILWNQALGWLSRFLAVSSFPTLNMTVLRFI